MTSTGEPGLGWRLARPAMLALLPRLSGLAIRATQRPFTRPTMLRPHVSGRRYGWTHYGVMLPHLPEPHRYFSTMIIAGLPGATAMDNDDAVATSPRDTATVSASTAAPGSEFFRAYSMAQECDLRPDGSVLDFGGDAVISGAYPDFQVSVRQGGFHADFSLRSTGQVAWFARTPFYDHLSLCVEYEGNISVDGKTTEASGLGTFEYAACAGPHGVRDRPISASAKVPVDFFSYHVIAVDERSQLLLADVHAMGQPLVTMAYYRTAHGSTWVTHRDVRFDVTEYATDITTDPYGHPMRLPVRFTWRAGTEFRVHGTVDSPPRFGVGRGYIVGYRCEGTHRGKDFAARGYMEYIDTKPPTP